MSIPLEGIPAMLAWDRTWRQHNVPTRFQKACLDYLRRVGRHQPGHRPFNEAQQLFDGLFDHYGSVGKGLNRPLITQPYNHIQDDLARSFAAAVGAQLEIGDRGIWHPETRFYKFYWKIHWSR